MLEIPIIDGLIDIHGNKIGKSVIEKFSQNPKGELYFKGPPGSGKSTALEEAALLVPDSSIFFYDEGIRKAITKTELPIDSLVFNDYLAELILAMPEKRLIELPACGVSLPKNRGIRTFEKLVVESDNQNNQYGFHITPHRLQQRKAGLFREVLSHTPPSEVVTVAKDYFDINLIPTNESRHFRIGRTARRLINTMATPPQIAVISREIRKNWFNILLRGDDVSEELETNAEEVERNLPESYKADSLLQQFQELKKLQDFFLDKFFITTEPINDTNLKEWAKTQEKETIMEAALAELTHKKYGLPKDQFFSVLNPPIAGVNWYVRDEN